MDMGQCNRIIINIVVIQSWFQILGGATERERERQRERQRQRETQRDRGRDRESQVLDCWLCQYQAADAFAKHWIWTQQMKSPTRKVAGLRSCDDFGWVQPHPACVTGNVWDVEENIRIYNTILLLVWLAERVIVLEFPPQNYSSNSFIRLQIGVCICSVLEASSTRPTPTLHIGDPPRLILHGR